MAKRTCHAACGGISRPFASLYSGKCSVCGAPFRQDVSIRFMDPMDVPIGSSPSAETPSEQKPVPALPPPATVSPPVKLHIDDRKAIEAVLIPEIVNRVTTMCEKVGERVEGSMRAMVAELLPRLVTDALPPPPLKIQINNLPEINAGVQHKQFPTLLKTLLSGVNIWLAGPSGSGKTTGAIEAAKVLKVPFFFTGAIGDAYGLMGYMDAQGRYVRTSFREAWEFGGLFLWDEVDASDPNALLAFNAALANGSCAFPDRVVPRHPGCLIVAAANTWGHGATHEYVGRMKMDAAFLKRFAFLSWGYDEELERATCENREWCLRVQEVRKAVAAKGLRVLVTPRESYIGARLLAAGIDKNTVEDMTIRSGMTDEQWSSVSGYPFCLKASDSQRKEAFEKAGSMYADS